METVKEEKKGSMKARVISAVVYLVIWVGMCALKWTVPENWGALGFDAVFCAVSVIGGFEFLRAIDGSEGGKNVKISTPQRAFTIAFCAVVIPLYIAVQLTMGEGFLAVAVAFTIYTMFLAATSVFDHGRSTVKGTINCVFCMLYCGVLSTMLTAINHLPYNSMAAILVLFMCTVLSDTGAFVLGSLLKKKIPFKIAPKLSPNKTVIGAVGGLIGGVLGGLLAYYTMFVFGGVNGVSTILGSNFSVYLTFTSERIHPIVSFILIGLCTSVMSQIGDLFESAIKRECGIKDMGNLMPGHGGALDRFDSMLYSGVLVLFCFGTIII